MERPGRESRDEAPSSPAAGEARRGVSGVREVLNQAEGWLRHCEHSERP